MAETRKYKVLEGKHDLGPNSAGLRKYARKGEIVELTDEQLAKFPNKFGPASAPIATLATGPAEEPKSSEE